MEKDKTTVRKPRQKRSIETTEKILDAAYRVFCEKGYYGTTTNEIAKVAGVSIGSLYSYFEDKDTIFMEIIHRYNQKFVDLDEQAGISADLYYKDKREWIRRLINGLIEIHESSIQLNRELHILAFSRPDLAAVMEANHVRTRKITLDCLYQFQDDLRLTDIEAAALVVYNLISSVVDQIVFEKSGVERERILRETIDALYQYLVK